MGNRQFYTMKFKSSRLKEFNYNIDLTFDEAKLNNEIVALFDNQILRSMRDIKNQKINLKHVNKLYYIRDKIKKRENCEENIKKIKRIQDNINKRMFIEDYITIVMEHTSHYKYMFKNGLILNGKKYIRFSSSASQARVSTVVFCEENIAKKLEEILNNGRNLDKKLTPSKFNAYKGLAGSSTHVVSTPRFCVVPDYIEKDKIKIDFVTETDWQEDDIIEPKEIEQEFNRFDGQGLISYEQSKKWAKELGLDYVPTHWIIRQNYIKGLLCTFPIHEFCEKINKGNYNIKSIYKNQDGDRKNIDLRNIDVILTESQFKLWDSFDSLEIYQENCIKNNLLWGVSLWAIKESDEKDILKMNYQFLQTLNLNKKDVQKICEKFVDWISGVNLNKIYYTLLFLLGKNMSIKGLKKYLESEDNYWIKSLIYNHDLIKDSYIKNKIYNLIKNKIKKACLGDIIIDGNFQAIIADPYAFMEYVCGKKVKGLLNKKEYYSNYWNKKDVKNLDAMRAPLTYISEHLKLNLKNNKELNYWFRYCYTGIITNVHGLETLHFGGNDFDGDFLATTSNKTIIKGIYKNELPIVYEVPKSQKMKLTEQDLFNADLFSFGSIIGSITNKSTSGYALLPLLEEDSEKYNIIMNRLKMCCKLQSAQIDKAKIGREVKGIPKNWTQYSKIEKNDSDKTIEQKELNNRILLDRHPYFFIYLYKDTKNKYKKHYDSNNKSCLYKFNITLKDLINKKRKTKEQKNFLENYYKFSPVIDSDCVMNNICKYIESINFEIKKKLKCKVDYEIYKYFMKNENIKETNIILYNKVLNRYKKFNKEAKDGGSMNTYNKSNKNKYNNDIQLNIISNSEYFKNIMDELCSNTYDLVDCLVYIFYVEFNSSNKDFLWNSYGKYLFENVKNKNNSKIYFPIQNKFGNIEYLGKKYILQEVTDA